ncbi:MAG TPA: glycosyltransferase family 1 protein [Bacteroidia bacterium]|nr:glycosyltransferase family 1 protein [Bacteroidia bacterium]
MQIAVNTRLLLKNKLEGIGWFSYQTLKRITEGNKDVHFIFIFDRFFDEEFIFGDNITPVIVGPQARHPFLYYAWLEFGVKNTLNSLKPDLFLSPDGFLSLSAKCKQLPVIHDINFLHNPKDVKPLTRKYYNHFFPKFAQKATRIATVSEFSKKDIGDNYKINSDKIDVVYNGINSSFKPVSDLIKTQTRQRFSKGKDYFLFVGSINPRKNISRLMQAFDAFKKESNSDLKLVIAGAEGWGGSEIQKRTDTLSSKEDIIFTGRLNEEDLANVMASAFALTFVPYFEGFGIPLVEAMQSEIPIITSNVTSLPEIAGDAALFVNPYEIGEIKNAMLQLINNSGLRLKLIEKGKQRKNNFSWDRSADLLWKSVEQALK